MPLCRSQDGCPDGGERPRQRSNLGSPGLRPRRSRSPEGRVKTSAPIGAKDRVSGRILVAWGKETVGLAAPRERGQESAPVGANRDETAYVYRFHRYPLALQPSRETVSPQPENVFTVPRSRFHRTKVTFSPHTYTVKRLAQNDRPDRGKRPRQRSYLGSPGLRPRRGRHPGDACGISHLFDPYGGRIRCVMGTPLPHTSTVDAVFVWGYQDSALRAVCPDRGEMPYECALGCLTADGIFCP